MNKKNIQEAQSPPLILSLLIFFPSKHHCIIPTYMNTEGSRQQHMAEEKQHKACAERLIQELGAANQSQKAWEELPGKSCGNSESH